MANTIFENIKISAIACAVPKNIKKITEFNDAVGEAEVKKFTKTTGVEQYHYVNRNQTTSDLCYVAAEKIIEEKNISRESIDGIIFLTQTPDYIMPATSHVLHKRLKLSQDCIAFDVNLGCSGYVYGLHIAASLLQKGSIKKILFLAGEVTTNNNPEADVKSDMLFGDAGTATLIEVGEGKLATLLKSDGEGYPVIITPGASGRNPIKNPSDYYKESAGELDGASVFEFTITEVPKVFNEFFEMNNENIESYDYFVLHQANRFMLKHIAKKIKLPLEKMPLSIDRYGNTSSATIPLTIVDLCDNQQVPQTIRLATSGFGIGLSWGVATFDIESADVLPMIITEDYYEEAYRGKDNI